MIWRIRVEIIPPSYEGLKNTLRRVTLESRCQTWVPLEGTYLIPFPVSNTNIGVATRATRREGRREVTYITQNVLKAITLLDFAHTPQVLRGESIWALCPPL